MERFGFRAGRAREWNHEGTERVPTDDWVVELPHQCDAWSIAGEDGEGVAHAEAVASLEAFIAEAQEALAALREQREFGDDA